MCRLCGIVLAKHGAGIFRYAPQQGLACFAVSHSLSHPSSS